MIVKQSQIGLDPTLTPPQLEMSSTKQTTIIPHSQEPLVTYEYPSTAELDTIVSRSVTAQKSWKNTPLEERIKIGHKFMVYIYGIDNNLNAHRYI